MYSVSLGGTLNLAELLAIPLEAGAIYALDDGAGSILEVGSASGVVTTLATGTGTVLVLDVTGAIWQRVGITVLAAAEAIVRSQIESNAITLTIGAVALQSEGNPNMTDRGIIGGIRLIDNSTPDAKLQTITTAGKVSNSATTATSANTASAIVARDADGKFTAAMISLTGTPTQSGDAATKGYVDSVALGLDVKASVKAATTANITLSGTQTVDGVSLIAGDRVLVKNQTNAVQNGVYVVAAGSWSRAADFDAADEVSGGAFMFVEQGTVNADTGWVVTSDGALTVGTDSIAFTQFSGAGSLTAGNGLTQTGTTFDVVAADGTIVVSANDIKVGTIADANVAANAAIAYSKLALASSIKNSDVASDAAIAYSKLSLSGSIVNADISASAAIAYSKLSLTGSIVNADVAAGAAIAYSKLALTGSIVNADIAANAAIELSKLAKSSTDAATADTLVLRDANGAAKFATPTDTAHAANKGYVDGQVGRFIANETPTGTIDGSNAAFSLAYAPAAGTLQLFINGLLLLEGTHFSVSGTTVTFTSPFQPQTGEWLRASYKKNAA